MAASGDLRLDERVLTTRVMGWPLGLASEHPGLGRCFATLPDHAPGVGTEPSGPR